MSDTPKTPALKIALFLIFTLSGFSGLIYESIWSHYLKLLLGHAAYAQTLVLTIFMGGMALGAWLASRYSRRQANPLKGYAIAEGLIGVLALIFHPLFTSVMDGLYLHGLPHFDHPATVYAIKWSVAALLILPQSILLGATFPLMSAGIIRLYPATAGATLGMLYFTNSLGAAVGVLASVFLLIPALGLPGTILTAGLCNIALAILVWGLAKGRDAPAATITTAPSAATQHSALPALPILLLGIALCSSLASFFYEIGWIRMLSLVLGSSTQAFELMLSAFILGLALGGLWIRRRLDHLSSPLRYAGHVQILMGLFAIGTLPLYNSSFDFMAFLLNSLTKTDGGYALFQIGSHAIALLIMLPATFMAGMTLPLFTYALLQHGEGERSIGRIYSANTVGAIIGVLLAVHVVMPAMGVKGLVSLGALLDILIGVGLLALTRPSVPRREWAFSGGAAGLIFIIIAASVHFDPLRMASGVYRYGISKKPADAEVLYYRDGKTATVSLLKNQQNLAILSTNGKPDASIQLTGENYTLDEVTMVMAAALPLSLHPTARTAANIGFGSGLTTHTLLTVPTLERVDTIEIEPFMVDAARGFGAFVERAYTDPRSQIHIEDAKTYFSSRNARYDLIISEPSNPWVSGVASLFTDEFYHYIRNHLNPNGLLVQWLQLYEIDMPLVSSVFQALSRHFDHYLIFNTDNSDLLIIASKDRPLDKLDPWIFAQPALQAQMARVGLKSLQDFEVRRLGHQAMLQPLFAGSGAPANSDYFPYLSLNAPKALYLRKNAELPDLHLSTVPILEMLDRHPRAGEAPATATPYFTPITFQQTARRIADALLSSDPVDFEPLQNQRFAIQILKRELAAGDDAPPPADALVHQALFDIATIINPLLPKTQVAPVWEMLASQPGYSRLSAQTQDWFALYRAVGLRDGAAMGDQAMRLITRTPKEKLSQNEALYVLTAGLTGYLSTGDLTQAKALIEAYSNGHNPLSAIPLNLQLLLRLLDAQKSA